MLKLDSKYSVVNNGTHGVELVFSEERVRKNKKGEEVPITYIEKTYYPNPVRAIQRWMAETEPNMVNVEELEKRLENIEIILSKIYKDYKENGYRL